jgi:hypothetical protein
VNATEQIIGPRRLVPTNVRKSPQNSRLRRAIVRVRVFGRRRGPWGPNDDCVLPPCARAGSHWAEGLLLVRRGPWRAGFRGSLPRLAGAAATAVEMHAAAVIEPHSCCAVVGAATTRPSRRKPIRQGDYVGFPAGISRYLLPRPRLPLLRLGSAGGASWGIRVPSNRRGSMPIAGQM